MAVNTDQDRAAAKAEASGLAKKSLHQLSLDAALESELRRTVEMFDLFVEL